MENPARLRSSIACLRCRRSKIKCQNTGQLDTACDNCIKSGKKCEWPDPTPLPPKRTDLPAGIKPERELGFERKRVRRLGDPTYLDGRRYAEEILTAQFIDRDLWDKVFVTYRRHFATELPFLHLPTLKNKVFGLLKGKKFTSPDVNLVLLGLLALTARYQPDLVKYVEHLPQDRTSKPRGGLATRSDASAASEFFANALDKAFGSVMDFFTMPASVERVQALLILGLYTWISQSHGGQGAWMYIGTAGRMAQALKLNFGDKSVATDNTSRLLPEEVIIEREVKRRTMYSCYTLDRLMSCGRGRVSFIRAEDLHIQLPCSDEDFDLSRQVFSGFLSKDDPLSTGASSNPNVLSRFVQLVDLWGQISRFSYAGGRFTEKDTPPWDEKSNWYQLRRKLEEFDHKINSSESSLAFSLSNYFKHDNGSSTFVCLHMLLSQCKTMLHREFIPFVPIKCNGPNGPVDAPTFPAETVPPGFFQESAKELFKAVRNIVEMIEICGDKLPHSSLVTFIIWTTAFVGIYARHFPQMDTEHSVVTEEEPTSRTTGTKADSSTVGATKTAFDALARIAQYSGLASVFVARFKDADEYFATMISDHESNISQIARGHNGGTSRNVGIRLGGDTGGIEEWVKKAEGITSNGTIIDEDRPSNAEGSDASGPSTLETGPSVGPDGSFVNSNPEQKAAPRTIASFMPINPQAPQSASGPGSATLSLSGQSMPVNGLNPPQTPMQALPLSHNPTATGVNEDLETTWTQSDGKCLGTGHIDPWGFLEPFDGLSGQMMTELWEQLPDTDPTAGFGASHPAASNDMAYDAGS